MAGSTMTTVFLMWLAGMFLIQPLTKRILSEQDKIRAEIRRKKMDDDPEYLSLLDDYY